MTKQTFEIDDMSTDHKLKITISDDSGSLIIEAQGYGDFGSIPDRGHPIMLELWEGQLRLVAFNDINQQEPMIVDMQNALEINRTKDNMANLYGLDLFTLAYMNAALFSSTESDGNSLGKNYYWHDFANETKKQIVEDCSKFQELYGHLFTRENCLLSNENPIALAGHDFWLTRCVFGGGFNDGEWNEPSIATILTDAAKNFGDIAFYLGDDGQIHHS